MKKMISAMLALSVLLMGGCFTQKAAYAAAPSNLFISVHAAKSEPSVTGVAVSAPDTATGKPVFDAEGIKGKVKNIFYDEAAKVIILADKLYLYDLVKGQTLAEADLPLTAVTSVQPVKNGYVVIGENDPRSLDGGGGMTGALKMTAASKSSGTQCFFYDSKLNKVSELALSRIHNGRHSVLFSDSIAISKDGNQMAYSTGEGLFLYDIAAKQESTLIQLFGGGSDGILGIAMIEEINFANKDKSVIFKAQSFDVPVVYGKESAPTCGLINTDGTGLINNKMGDYSIYELTNSYDGFALFAEDFRSPTGRVLKMDTNSGKTQFLKSSEKKETAYVAGSDKGGYYATAVMGETACTVYVYETATGKRVSEQKAVYGEEIYGFRAPSVKVIDATKTCIILLGNTQSDEYPTKVFVHQF